MTLTYSILFTAEARRQLKKLGKAVQVRLLEAIEALAILPRPSGMKKLKGGDGFYRIRVGDYRVVYQVNDGELLILVILVGNRRDIYDKL